VELDFLTSELVSDSPASLTTGADTLVRGVDVVVPSLWADGS
jgi:hypothetical protein